MVSVVSMHGHLAPSLGPVVVQYNVARVHGIGGCSPHGSREAKRERKGQVPNTPFKGAPNDLAPSTRPRPLKVPAPASTAMSW